MKAMNRFSSNIMHEATLSKIHYRNRSALSLARRTLLRHDSNFKHTEHYHTKSCRSILESVSCISKMPQNEKKHETTHDMLQFGRLDQRDALQVVDKVIAPAFYGSDVNYHYLYPDEEDRRTAVYLRFNSLIPKFAAKPHSTASYVLYDEAINEYIGHVLLYKPKNNQDAHSGKLSNILALFADDDHESNTLKFVRQILATKWMDKATSLLRIGLLSCAMKNEYKHIDRVINEHNDNCGYWEISGVSINPSIQSKGYGSMIMKCVHDVVNKRQSEDASTRDIPTILFTSTPAALKFYLRLGYKVFMEHNISDDITSYSLVYHSDAGVLEKWVAVLREHIPYYHSIDKWNLVPKMLRPEAHRNEIDEYINESNLYQSFY